MSHNLRPLLAVGVLITRMEVMMALGSDEEAQKAELVTAGAIYALSHALSGEALSEFLLQMEIGPIRAQELIDSISRLDPDFFVRGSCAHLQPQTVKPVLVVEAPLGHTWSATHAEGVSTP